MDANTKMLNSFLERGWFHSWKNKLNDNFSTLELIINDHCDQACKYCYEIKYGDFYFTEESRNPENILKNIRLIIRWLKDNKYYPKIELFSSEIFSQELGFEVFDALFEEMDENFGQIMVPTNMNFIFDDVKVSRVEKIIDRFKEKNINVSLSASIDGAFMEENRPICSGLQRDSIFYDKLFAFAKKHGIGFHPMVYSNRIEHWKDNWEWFQENFKKHDIPFKAIYLLEVRNVEWTAKQVTELGKFIRFLIKWTFDFLGRDKEKMRHFFMTAGYNILQSPFITIGRGLGCGIQSSLTIRTGDLSIVPCHRTSYEQFHGGKFIVEDDKIIGIEGKNVLTYMTIKSFDSTTQPFCEYCYLKHMCSKGCLGSQFEITGDLFTPIPTVCRLEHVKTAAILDELNKIGCLGKIYSLMSEDKRNSILFFMEELV
jgi:radical SAM protein with 4Fe4S-binding SPASM domain